MTVESRNIDVLLIEDDAGDVDLILEVLEEQSNLRLTIARDGQEAIDYLLGTKGSRVQLIPNLIILDLNLPRKGGLDVLETIKNNPGLNCIPVVILTTSDAERDITSAYRLGASCYVSKPLGLTEYQEVISAVQKFWFTVVKYPPRY